MTMTILMTADMTSDLDLDRIRNRNLLSISLSPLFYLSRVLTHGISARLPGIAPPGIPAFLSHT
jgi:hypothetical protein